MTKSWHIENPLNCPMVVAINAIGGKWKPVILHMLSSSSMRFGELKKNIPPVSQKMLTQQLRELEQDGIVTRTAYAEVPPRVEYALSAVGMSLVPVIDALYRWGQAYSDQLLRPTLEAASVGGAMRTTPDAASTSAA